MKMRNSVVKKVPANFLWHVFTSDEVDYLGQVSMWNFAPNSPKAYAAWPPGFSHAQQIVAREPTTYPTLPAAVEALERLYDHHP